MFRQTHRWRLDGASQRGGVNRHPNNATHTCCTPPIALLPPGHKLPSYTSVPTRAQSSAWHTPCGLIVGGCCRTATAAASSPVTNPPHTLKGRSSPTHICTRRRCPSDTWCMRHSGSMSSTLISRCLRASSTPGMELIMRLAGKSPCVGGPQRQGQGQGQGQGCRCRLVCADRCVVRSYVGTLIDGGMHTGGRLRGRIVGSERAACISWGEKGKGLRGASQSPDSPACRHCQFRGQA